MFPHLKVDVLDQRIRVVVDEEALLLSHAIYTSHLIKLSQILASRVHSIMYYYVANSVHTILATLVGPTSCFVKREQFGCIYINRSRDEFDARALCFAVLSGM